MEKFKISEVCNISNGFAFKSEKYVNDNGARVIRITNVQKGKIVDNDPKLYPFSELDKLEAYKIFEGDILMSLTGNVGRVGRFPKELLPAYINQRVCRVMPKNEKLDTNFLFHFLNSDVFENEAIKNSAGAAQLNLSTKWLGDFEIPLPSLATQQRIAAILDQADAIIQNNRAIVQKYDALTQSLFLDMFGDPVKNEKGWDKDILKNLCLKITDGTHFSPEPQKDGFPYVTAKHVKSFGLDFYSKPTFVSEEAHNEIYKRCTPEFGDVLYIKDGATTGIACLNTFNEPISLLSSLALLKPNYKILNNYYLCYWLNNSKVKLKLLGEFMSGAAIQRYTLTKINSFQLIIPPIELQYQFAERVAMIEAQKQQAQLELAKSEELFNSLLQRAFNGELN